MLKAEVDEMYERSKNDRAMFVGSEIRQLCGEIYRLTEQVLELEFEVQSAQVGQTISRS